MRPFRRRAPVPVPVTAAAKVAENGTLDHGSTMSRQVTEAWEVWRLVGEIHYATTQQARLISRVNWDLTINGDLMEPEQSADVFRAAFGKDMQDLARQKAVHLQVAGAYHFARINGHWKVIPYPPDHRGRKLLEESDIDIINRVPDPRDPGRTDSPVLAALDVARELLLARAQARSAARNRTAQLNTVLYPLEGAGPDTKAFEKKLTAVMTAPLENEMSTSSVVPNVIGFQGEWIDKWRTMDLTGPIDEKLHQKIPVLVRQLAVILDSPPELLLGMGDVNHWSSWAIQEDNWLAHVEPLADTIGEGFALALATALDVDPEMIEVTPDPAPLLKRRPALADVLAAHAAGLVNDEYVRRELGADEDDAPDAPPEQEPPAVEEGPAVQEPAPVAAGFPPAVLGMLQELSDGFKEQARVAAAPSFLVDLGNKLAGIDTQAYDSVEDLAIDTGQRALERLGARVRSIGQGQDLGVQGADMLSNAELAVAYGKPIPNSEVVIEDTVSSSLTALTRIVERAFDRLADLGVEVEANTLADAQAVYTSAMFQHVQNLLSRRPGIEKDVADRVVHTAGGGSDFDTAVKSPGTRAGIALGVFAIQLLAQKFKIVPDEYVWVHQTRGKGTHPEHKNLDGEVFNGRFILRDGINWFPGDHHGCRCLAVPRFEETA